MLRVMATIDIHSDEEIYDVPKQLEFIKENIKKLNSMPGVWVTRLDSEKLDTPDKVSSGKL